MEPTFGRLRLWLWLPLVGTGVAGVIIALFAPEFWGVPIAVGVDVLGLSLVAQLVLRRRRLSQAGAAWASAAVALAAMLTFMMVVTAGDELLSLVGYWPRGDHLTVTELVLQGLLFGSFGLVYFGWLVLPIAAGTGALAWRHHHHRLARK